ncbi:lipocalin-like domain-containing protein [Ferruginibacter sp. SUN106]|uniref:lipocalin-like domain-containing protein n=1 Tax=Ferruginibacter sp. SUN106 TaxID=2978348 RepID=UPI003D365E88
MGLFKASLQNKQQPGCEVHKTQISRIDIQLALLLICTCSFFQHSYAQKNKLAGTWQLISFSDFDPATNTWVQPYGEHPLGYFTYTKSGIVNLNVSSQKPLHFSADSAKKRCFTIYELLFTNGANYFGTYTIDYKNSTVTHYPVGGNIPWYINTCQKRQFKIKGDTLIIGDPTFEIGKRILVKVD